MGIPQRPNNKQYIINSPKGLVHLTLGAWGSFKSNYTTISTICSFSLSAKFTK